mgnify:CR=1 FL=1
MPDDAYFRLTHRAGFATDLDAGVLSPDDRELWLRNWDQPSDTPDGHILLAIGLGFG